MELGCVLGMGGRVRCGCEDLLFLDDGLDSVNFGA